MFKDLTSLDLHQAEYHQKKVTLRIATKEETDEVEEEKKIPTITAEQYERMNKDRKNEHFPTLSGVKEYRPTGDASNNKRSKKLKDGPG